MLTDPIQTAFDEMYETLAFEFSDFQLPAVEETKNHAPAVRKTTSKRTPAQTIDAQWIDAKVRIHPEIAAVALQKRIEDIYLLWLVIKRIDAHFGGQGLVARKKLHDLARMLLMMDDSSKHVYSRVTAGAELFWTKAHGQPGAKRMGLVSYAKVYETLGSNIPPCAPVEITIHDLLTKYNQTNGEGSGRQSLRAFLVGVLAARHGDGRPVSYGGLCEATGMSRSTLQRHTSACTGLTSTPNFVAISSAPSVETAKFLQRQLIALQGNKYRIIIRNGRYLVCQQQPNSYWFTQLSRVSRRKRHSALRAHDKHMLYRLHARRYCTDPRQLKKSNIAPTYCIPEGAGWRMKGTQVHVWSSPAAPIKKHDHAQFQKDRDAHGNRLLVRVHIP